RRLCPVQRPLTVEVAQVGLSLLARQQRSAQFAQRNSASSRQLADISAPHGSQNGRYGISDWDCRDHSALMLAARSTLPHFSVSSAMNLPKSAGEPANTVPPSSARRLLSAGSERPALISLLSFPMMSAGVFLGAPTPPQALASKPGKKSPTVGMSGS